MSVVYVVHDSGQDSSIRAKTEIFAGTAVGVLCCEWNDGCTLYLFEDQPLRFPSRYVLPFAVALAPITMYFHWALPVLSALACATAAGMIPGRKTCVVPASGSNTTNDAPAILTAFKQCGRGGRVVFKPTTYYLNSVLNITWLEDVDIDIQGELLVCCRLTLG